MRLTSASWLVLAAAAGAACSHSDLVTVIERDGTTAIPSIDLSTNAAGGLVNGTRAINRFFQVAPFDTSVYDAFGRSKTTVPNFMTDPNGYYGSGSSRFLYYGAGANVPNFTPPNVLLPAIINTGQSSYNPYGTPSAVTYIVPGGHPGNGGHSWEFWYVIRDLVNSQRYVMGLARYALKVNGALDWSEMLLTGAITQPDSLVFLPGDFTPGGNKDDDNGFIVDCSKPAEGRPVDGANPFFIAGKTVAAVSASKRIIIDHTICSDNTTVWSDGFNSAKSPIQPNNIGPGRNQYNFLVVWEALADSTPDYGRPVWREQVAPMLTTTGEIVKNGFAPIPTAALTATQMAPLPGATSRPDTLKMTFNNLMPLASGAYQVWLLRKGTDTAQLVTGRIVRLNGSTVVDTLANASEFNTSATITGARMEVDVNTYPGVSWNAATLAIAATTGNTTLPAVQPIWTTSVYKFPGAFQFAAAVDTMRFGSFNKGVGTVRFGAAGGATGGLFGRELREDVSRLPRPPLGYMYESWLIAPSAANNRNVGTLLTPFPDLRSLADADTMQSAPLSGVELTRSALRVVGDSVGTFCQREGSATTFARTYTTVQVRLKPKNAVGTLPPTIVLSGTFNMAARTVNDSVKACK